MKVQIKEIRSGKIKTLDKRFADILVKLKQAEYYEEPVEKAATYQTKVMTAAPISSAAPQPVTVPPPETATSSAPAPAPQEPLETPAETVNNDDDKPKHRGRPRKNTYETKVMTAEE